MRKTEIAARAKALSIDPAGLALGDLIRSIQRAEGNFDCFGKAQGFCDQEGCAWRTHCLAGESASAKPARASSRVGGTSKPRAVKAAPKTQSSGTQSSGASAAKATTSRAKKK